MRRMTLPEFLRTIRGRVWPLLSVAWGGKHGETEKVAKGGRQSALILQDDFPDPRSHFDSQPWRGNQRVRVAEVW